MIPKLSGMDLLCPSCQGTYLHHDKVDVFECGEDATHGVHVAVGDGTAKSGNPSRVRQSEVEESEEAQMSVRIGHYVRRALCPILQT